MLPWPLARRGRRSKKRGSVQLAACATKRLGCDEARAAMAAAAEASLAPLQRGQDPAPCRIMQRSLQPFSSVQGEVLETSLLRGLWAD